MGSAAEAREGEATTVRGDTATDEADPTAVLWLLLLLLPLDAAISPVVEVPRESGAQWRWSQDSNKPAASFIDIDG